MVMREIFNIFIFVALVMSGTTQHAMSQEFGAKWGIEVS